MSAIAVILAPAAVCVAAQDAEYSTPPPAQILSTEISGGDLLFFTDAARQTAFLVRLSTLTKSHAVTPEVQELAAAAWKEQTDAVARLKDLAARKQVPLAEEPDGPGKKALQTLAKLRGPKLDKSCLDAMADAEDALESTLQAGAASTDRDIKAFAQSGLAALKQQRDKISRLGV